MKHLIIVMGFVLGMGCSAQAQDDAKINTDDYLVDVEVAPELIGGIAELSKHIKYPEEALKAGIQGTVIVTTYVEKNGTVSKYEIARSDNDLLSESALEAVRQVQFKAGMQDGKPVQCVVRIPVKYKLK